MLAKLIGPELRRLLESIGSPTFVLEVRAGEEVALLEANTMFEEGFGLGSTDYRGTTLQQLYPYERGEKLARQSRQCILEEEAVEAVECLERNNTVSWWRFSFRPIRDAQGLVVRVLGSATDISHQVRLENQLRYEHLLLKVQREMMPDGVLVVSEDGRYLSWNEKFRTLLCLSESDMHLGKAGVDEKLEALITDPQRFKERVESIIASPSAEPREEEFLLKDGRTLVFISRGLIDQNGGSYGRLWFVRDVTAARQSEQALRNAHAAKEAQNLLLKTLLDVSPDGILVVTGDNELLSWNQRLKEVWEISDDDLTQGLRATLQRALVQIQAPDAFLEEAIRHSEAPGGTPQGQELHLRDGRTLVWYKRRLATESRDFQGHAWFFRDVTERQRMIRELLEAREWERGVLNSTRQAIVTTDDKRVVRTFNPAAERMLGYAADEVVGKFDTLIFHDMEEVEKRRVDYTAKLSRPVDLDELFTLESALASPTVREWTYVAKDGRRIPVELCTSQLRDSEGRRLGSVCVATDISERKAYEQRLKEMAWTDPLTAIWNRRRFLDVAEKQIVNSRRRGTTAAFLLIDIDHFKQINDSFGHDVGDVVLKMVAKTLSSSLRIGDFCCRWGGEEFAVLLVNATGSCAAGVAERIRNSLREMKVHHETSVIGFTASIGLTMATPGLLTQAIKRADDALYMAKNAGRDRIIFC